MQHFKVLKRTQTSWAFLLHTDRSLICHWDFCIRISLP